MVTKTKYTVKKTPATKRRARKINVTKGDKYACDVCGFAVVVEEDCGCAQVHEILCCSKPMKVKKKAAAAAN